MLFHSRREQVVATCEALSQQTRRPDLVRIHLNDASDAEAAELAGHLPSTVRWQVAASQENRGFSGAHNAHLAAAQRHGVDAVLVLNPDVALAPDALEVLIAAAEACSAPCLVGPLLELAEDDMGPTGLIDSAGIRWTRTGRHLDDLQGAPLALAPRATTVVAGLTGACLLVPAAAHRAITVASGEFFDEDFFAYREDAELGLRCRRLGVECLLVPAATGRHARRLRGTSRNVSADINRLGVQNRLLIRFKHGRWRPGTWPLPTLRDLVVAGAALTAERSSRPGLTRALRLRRLMREKSRRLDLARR